MILNSPFISGSLTVTGNTILSGSITSLAGIAGTASYATNAEMLDGLDSTSFTTTSSFNTASSSFSTRVANTEATSSAFIAASGSLAARIASNEARTGSFATTGSNQFNGNQTVTGSLTATGTITAQTLVVQTITSSVDFVTGSTRFGSTTGNTHQFTGSMLVSGSISSVGAATFSSPLYTNLIVNGTNSTGWGNNIAFQSGSTDFGYIGSIGSLLGNTTKDMTIWSTDGNGFRVYTNGNNLRLTIDSTGTATFAGALSGTSATFSGDITIHSGIGTSLLTIGGTNGDYATAINLVGNNTFKNWQIGSNTGVQGSLEIRSSTAAGGTSFTTPVLSLASSGTATFSGNVTSLAASGQATIIAEGSATSGEGAVQVKGKNSSGTSRTCQIKYDNADVFRIGTPAAIAMQFETSDTPRMYITSTGNVGIGTTSPSYLLDVNGTGRFNGTANTMLTLDSNNSNGYTAFQINFGGAAKALVGFGTYLTTDGGVAIRTAASTPFTIAIGGATPNFTIASTGASTFASSVTAGTDFRTDGGTVKVGAGSNNYYTQMSTAYIFPYIDSYFDSVAGASYEGRIIFRTSSGGGALGTRMTILNNGNVGIGDTSPSSKLSINGSLQLNGTITNLGTGAGTYTQSTWYVDSSNQILFENGRTTDSAAGTGRTVYFTWRGGPSVGGGVQLQHGANAWAAYTSDARLKTVVANVGNGLEAIMKLNPIKYKWTKELETSRTVLGFTAQNVGEAIPEAMFKSWEDEELGDVLSYYQEYLTPYLVKAVQELSTKNTTLEARLAALESA
jgi:hypothetical protein